MRLLLHLIYVLPILWLIKRDTARRKGITTALWIPTLWIGIIATKYLSQWVGGGGGSSLDGSPIDALFFLCMMVAAFIVLVRREVNWGKFISSNWSVLLLYAFLLISVFWANSTSASFKRWVKEYGNILIALVILTEPSVTQAIKAIFIRCAYVFFPLSYIYTHYFPDLGRRYSPGGGTEITGVTTQKNSLGILAAFGVLMIAWDLLSETKRERAQIPRWEKWLRVVIFTLGVYLLYLSNSQTSLLCVLVGLAILTGVRFPLVAKTFARFGVLGLAAAIGLFILGGVSGLSESLVATLGRDMTLTGRTDVWREVLALRTDPIFGVGFMSFWDDPSYRSQLPYWASGPAHNGYLEIYLMGGLIGVSLLTLMIVATGVRIHWAMKQNSEFATVRFAFFVIALLANYSESNFAFMSPVGMIFLLASIGEGYTQPHGGKSVLSPHSRNFRFDRKNPSGFGEKMQTN